MSMLHASVAAVMFALCLSIVDTQTTALNKQNDRVVNAISKICQELARHAGDEALQVMCRDEIHRANQGTLLKGFPLESMHRYHDRKNVRCLQTRPDGLCLVDMNTFPFAAPNYALPEPSRGVVMVIAPDDASGWTNPSIDLNRFTPNNKTGTFWVDGAVPQYQTWLDINKSYTVFNTQKEQESIGVRNELNSTDDGPQLTISLFSGKIHVPASVFYSPTVRLSEHVYNRSIVILGKTKGTWPAYRIIDAYGNQTEFYAKMIDHCGGKAVTRPNI